MENNKALKNFLEIPYGELEAMNLRAQDRAEKASSAELEKEYRAYLQKEKRIKAVTLCFTDLEGRFHMLDYDKKFLLGSANNLTFDGSSIRGFSQQHESDLRLLIDWGSIRFLPSDIFGPGKVIIFVNVLDRDRLPYISDFRGQLKLYAEQLQKKNGITAYASAEVEGFLVDGINAEQEYEKEGSFNLISTGGYYHSLPLDRLRVFIDRAAEAQRAMGFKNEKDHPEVAPSQFEMNFSYSDIVRAADNVQLYKLVCRQVANSLGMTATFLPKPFVGINGSGMHTNVSLAKKGKNIFYDKYGKDGLSAIAWDFIWRILNHAPETCLVFNSSVNAYRRLDPHFEAPNQIKVSPIDRGSMIRIPVGDERSTRIEIRSIAPDSNPYLALYTIIKTGIEGKVLVKDKDKRDRLRVLPDNINDAIKLFKGNDFIGRILHPVNQEKYAEYKQNAADRSPKALGSFIKSSEVVYHHEVTNQVLWHKF
ncbi:MAG: Glutamine synthetase [Candidatus Nomurabacteria bacterium GW2011_GWC2_41_8]|uniref:Glutamine synthetase n=3 Tax=Candidatus Nomuraibacteriota TaxID=1752729 RepID=A0A1F6YDW6_9BACT|nr:MAG: Glutamine synthetase [Candidatus Nomurabacteria bacterium GW2011_GWC2_41_8]OGI66956.1 MAG: glutamine synthetase [Candidatus Nomurabacteria bacterium RIFCSPHIGHO2_01_FULL_41_91]OGI80435.1 MAG: glutamine synthetase [Candidatus Nomurabacteria bacterium RIFCSPHIGHO2_02_FULL_41_52]OGI85101.1 MAG: glutamine synthetase [Candidatus Nomurabacteria bacterium RIFCSPHIGHO2_12_FULL_42_19]OGI94060.1 MAG: glutamine synthetase [Candidatus Nomurabacteria bacterium RIFCSPLOWO2_01_FULL_41_52]OGI99585.1 M